MELIAEAASPGIIEPGLILRRSHVMSKDQLRIILDNFMGGGLYLPLEVADEVFSQLYWHGRSENE